MKLIDGFDSNYRYILVAARRARQLQSGAPPVVDTSSRKPCRIAQDEIRAGKVKWEIPETRSAAERAGEMLDRALGNYLSLPGDLPSPRRRREFRRLRPLDCKCHEDRSGRHRRDCCLQGG